MAMRLNFVPAASLFLWLLAAGGCSLSGGPRLAPPSYYRDDLPAHAILVNEDGLPCDPIHYQPYSTLEEPAPYQDQLKRMLDGMEGFFDDPSRVHSPTRKILIFVHGGMNTPDDSRNAASIALRDMTAEGSDYYPFFLNWNSGPFSSLAEHLSNPILTDGPPNSIISPPAYLAADLGRAVTRSPIVLARMTQNDVDAMMAALASAKDLKDQSNVWENRHLRNSLVLYYVLNHHYQDGGDAIHVSVGDVHVSSGEWFRRGAQFAAGFPTKIVTTPLLDALGQGAYEKMLRRAHGMFSNPGSSQAVGKVESEIERDLDHGQEGAIPIFLDQLLQHLKAHADPARPYEITIIGHSMGTIIINRIVDFYPELPINHIVFLGAACTIDDFRITVIPFLKSHPDADFFNLSLHPTAEALDDEATDLVTRGSLLVWIDKFLDEPQTPQNRTMGQWSNILEATYIFPKEMRSRITLKAYPMLDPGKITRATPQVHSALSKIRFWDSDEWKADAARPESDVLIQRAKLILAEELSKHHTAPKPQ